MEIHSSEINVTKTKMEESQTVSMKEKKWNILKLLDTSLSMSDD